MVDLSIIVVSWNTRELLRDCLVSVYRHTSGITFELFVVDNCSSDGSAEMVRTSFPGVILIENNHNAGFSKANNQAIRVSTGKYVGLLNSDTILVEDVFTPLLEYADKHDRIGAIGPKMFYPDGQTIQNSCARNLPNLYFDFCRLSGLSRRFPTWRLFGGEYMSYWDHDSSRSVKSLSGACMVVRRNTINQVGLMDEHQFMFGDEIEWCKRIGDARWDIYYHAKAAIIHYGGESARQAKQACSIEAEKAQMYFYRKYKGRPYAFLFSLQVFFFNLSKYAWSKLFRNKNSRVRDVMNIYRTMYKWSFREIVNRRDQKLI